MSPLIRLAVNAGAVGIAVLTIAGLAAAVVITGHREPPPRAERIATLTWDDDELRSLLPGSERLSELAAGASDVTATVSSQYDLASDVIPTSVEPPECVSLLWVQPAAEEMIGGSANAFVDDSTFRRVTATAQLYASPATAQAAFAALVDGYDRCSRYSYHQIRFPEVEYVWRHDDRLQETSVGIPVLRVESSMSYTIDEIDYRQEVTTALYSVGDAVVGMSVSRFDETDATVALAEMRSVEDRLEGAVLAALERAAEDG